MLDTILVVSSGLTRDSSCCISTGRSEQLSAVDLSYFSGISSSQDDPMSSWKEVQRGCEGNRLSVILMISYIVHACI